MTHTCRESADPRCKGRCACGKRMVRLDLDDLGYDQELKRMREFDTGATRDTDEGKYDYAGFLSPYALTAFAEYMHEHRVQADGSLREAGNWKRGIPTEEYLRSMFRHFIELWTACEDPGADRVEALCALMFNVQGFLHEEVRPRG